MVRAKRIWLLINQFPSYVIGLSGLLAGLVFSAGLPGWLLPVLLIPWFYYASQDHSWRDHIWFAAWFFLPFHAIVLSWFYDTNINGLIGASHKMALVAQLVCWLIMVTVMTLCMLPLGIVIGRLRPLAQRFAWQGWLILPAAWVGCEWLRSIGFSIIGYGRGATLGDYWNFGSLGLGIMQTPLAYLSRWIGLYGLTFLVVVLALALGRVLVWKTFRPLSLLALCLLLLIQSATILTNHQNRSAATQSASVLQRSLDSSDYRGAMPIQNASSTKKQLIVLPEYSELYDEGAGQIANAFVNQRLATEGISVDVDRGNRPQWYGTLEFRDAHGTVLHSDTKQLLIPSGEYLPSIISTFYQVTGQHQIINRFEKYRRVYKGNPPVLYHTPTLTIGPVACSGILGRPIYQKLARDGATVLTNSASLVDFNGSKSYFRQSILMARFHAIANNRVFIQSSRGAPAFVLDNNGHYIVAPGSIGTRFIDFSFHPLSAKTVYSDLGEWVLVASFTILVLTGLGRQRNARRLK